MSPREAAQTVHARIAALPGHFRRAAFAWLRPAATLESELGGSVSRPTSAGAETGPPPVHGVPYLLKDLFDLAGAPTQAGSTFLNTARGTPERDGALPARLQELGAACAGKTHLVEFAAGLFGDNSHYGDCPHPRDPTRLSGGSSSGSAALVAAGVVPLAVGTDTGGSVRVPAAFCGIHGFRLSPRDKFIGDAVPLSPSLDTAGWFTANAADMMTAISALVGPATQGPRPRGCYVPAGDFGISFDPATATACNRAASALAPQADEATRHALLDSWQDAIEAYTITALHEAHQVHRAWLGPYREHYEPGIWQRFTDGGRYSPDQLAKAASTFARVRGVFRQFFEGYDYLILPATPFPALRKADCTAEARKALLTLTTPASLAGLPTLTIPVALPSGLTSGLQIILPTADSPVVPWVLKR